MKRQSFLFFVIFGFFSLFLISCDCDIQITLHKNGGILVELDAKSGNAFKQMLMAGTGAESEDLIYDTNEIAYQLAKNAFTNVRIKTSGSDFHLTMEDTNEKSYLFKSGILVKKDGKLQTNINEKNLLAFYDSSDDQTQSILDIFIAPVFNDERMSAQEYIDLMATVYGQEIADEIAKSSIKIILKNPDGKETKQIIPLADILTIQ